MCETLLTSCNKKYLLKKEIRIELSDVNNLFYYCNLKCRDFFGFLKDRSSPF